MRTFAKSIFLLGLLLPTLVMAFVVPRLTGPVVDDGQLLSRRAQEDIASLLRGLNDRGQAQLQVLTVKTLNGESIESASIQVVDQWQLGTKTKDNGVLFLIAAADRALRIEVGQGLEGDLPDIYAKRIIEDVVVPIFRSRDFDEGVRSGVLAIIEKVDPQYFEDLKKQGALAGRSASHRSAKGADDVALHAKFKLISILLFLFLSFFRGFMFRRLGLNSGRVTGGAGGIFSGGGGWGGGGGYSGGGGWGGGGGGFSGGGASGRW